MSVIAIQNDIIGWSILAIGASAAFLVSREGNALRQIIFAAFALRCLSALAGYYFLELPDSAADAAMFYHQATDWGAHGWIGVLENFKTGAYLYPSLMAMLFQITGSSHLVMLAINVCLGTMLVFAVYRLAQAVGDDRTARIAGWTVAVWPTLILYASVSLREVMIVLPLVIGMIYLIRWRSTDLTRHLVGCFLALFVATLFHTGIGAALLAVGVMALVTGLISLTRLYRSLHVIRYVPAAVLIAGLAVFVLSTGIGLEKIGGTLAGFGLEDLAQAQQNRAIDRASYLDDYVLGGASDLLTQAPLRVGYFMFSPFPWNITGALDFIGFADAMLYATLIFCTLIGLKVRPASRRKTLSLLFVAASIVYLFAFVTSNSGTAVRHRAKLAPILIVTAAVGVPILRRRMDDVAKTISRYGKDAREEASEVS